MPPLKRAQRGGLTADQTKAPLPGYCHHYNSITTEGQEGATLPPILEVQRIWWIVGTNNSPHKLSSANMAMVGELFVPSWRFASHGHLMPQERFTDIRGLTGGCRRAGCGIGRGRRLCPLNRASGPGKPTPPSAQSQASRSKRIQL